MIIREKKYITIYLLESLNEKDTLLSKWDSVIFKKHKFEFVPNDWIIVHHYKRKIAQKNQ